MGYYMQKHKHYCGIDLHAKTMYLCIMDADGNILFHKNMKTERELFLSSIRKYREDLCVSSECMQSWYWLADVCEEEGIPFVLGHALGMRLIHGSKSKNDKVDSERITTLLRIHNMPMAYVYPKDMRSTRDLLRRRINMVRKRAELLAHIQNTNNQYNLPEIEKKLQYTSNRAGVAARFKDNSARMSIEVDLEMIACYDKSIKSLDSFIERAAKADAGNDLRLLQTIRGVGKILSLTMLYEIEDITRFERVQNFLSFARLVKGQKESAGKIKGTCGGKMGNANLKWAFSESAVLFLRHNPEAKEMKQRLERKHGKAKALSILATRLGRAVYYMLLRNKSFDMNRFMKV